MGFKEFDDENNESYFKFKEGDNALVKLTQLDTKFNDDKEGQDGNDEPMKYELEMRFDAVHEYEADQRGTIAYWPNSKITVKEDKNFTSNLALFLQEAGILEDVLHDLVSDEAVEVILDGDGTFEVESDEENRVLMKAISQHYVGQVLRASTTQVGDSYSRVDEIIGKSNSDPFEEESDDDGEEDQDDSDSESDSEKEAVFDDDDGDGETGEDVETPIVDE